MSCRLLDDELRLHIFGTEELGRWCAAKKLHFGNVAELLRVPAAGGPSRMGCDSHVRYGFQRLSSIKWIARSYGSVEELVPVSLKHIDRFIASTASARGDMVKLRSVKNLTSFLSGHKIKGVVRSTYGACPAVPDGWRLAAEPPDATRYFVQAELPW